VRFVRIAELSERAYQGHPSCTTCKVDYLGEGQCGACLFVANLVADSVIVLDKNALLELVREAAQTLIESPKGVSHEVVEDWWHRHIPQLEVALAALDEK
jgi:hypothetical protein